MDINSSLLEIKREMEKCISTAKIGNEIFVNGSKAKESFIRSSKLINYIHETVKYELIRNNIHANNIFPPLGCSNPEIKLAGFLKQKDQDITVLPKNIEPERTEITWGPLAHENIIDTYGFYFTEKCLVINVRSQMSSLAKNSDTLFERTFAEAMNLHAIYKKIVLGDVYLIPVYEYDEAAAKKNKVKFSHRHTNLEKYISFFTAVNNRKDENDDEFKYEKCALLVVDFSKEVPKLYSTTEQLKNDNLVNEDFDLELYDISLERLVPDLIRKYSDRFDPNYIIDND